MRRRDDATVAEPGRIADIPKDADLTAIQRGIVDVIQSGEPRVNADGLKVLDQLQWPVRYLDFEAVMPTAA